MRLDRYNLGSYTPGAAFWKQLLWYYLGDHLVRSRFLTSSPIKAFILRLFGATLGEGIRIKTGVRIKFPWRLTVGSHVWIGEDAWLDNVAPISIGDHVCLSQGVYLCTGNHDWQHPAFALMPSPIRIEQKSWIAAKAVVGPGLTVGEGSILSLGSVAVRSLEAMTIYAGNPAQPIKKRSIVEQQDSDVQDFSLEK